MNPVKVALIGAGGMANAVHYPSVTALEDVDVVGLCDLDEERLGRTAERFGITATFIDFRRMLDQTRPDAVYALMPPHVLHDVAFEVLDRGHHLFIEKPPAVTTFQAEALARVAEARGVVTAVGFQRRYHPMVHHCWEQVQRTGEINQVVSCFYKNQPPQEAGPYYNGAMDILHCDAIHAVDALRYYAGLSEVRAVASEVRRLDCWYPASFNSLVYFENGCVGILQANWRTGRRFLKFEFHTAGASAYADIDGEATLWRDNRDEPDFRTTCTEFAGSDQTHIAQGFYAESRAFIDAVRAGQPPHNNLRDAARSMELADRILASAINPHSTVTT